MSTGLNIWVAIEANMYLCFMYNNLITPQDLYKKNAIIYVLVDQYDYKMIEKLYSLLESDSPNKSKIYARIITYAFITEYLEDSPQITEEYKDSFKTVKDEYRIGSYSDGHFNKEFERFAAEIGEVSLLEEMADQAKKLTKSATSYDDFILSKMISHLPDSIQDTINKAMTEHPITKINFNGNDFLNMSEDQCRLFESTITLLKYRSPSLEFIEIPQQDTPFPLHVYKQLISLNSEVQTENDWIQAYVSQKNPLNPGDKAPAPGASNESLFLYHHNNRGPSAQAMRDLFKENLIQHQKGWEGRPENYTQRWDGCETRWSYFEQAFEPCESSTVDPKYEAQRKENLAILSEMRANVTQGNYSDMIEWFHMSTSFKDIIASGEILDGDTVGKVTNGRSCAEIYLSTRPEHSYGNFGFALNYKHLDMTRSANRVEAQDFYWVTQNGSMPILSKQNPIKYIVGYDVTPEEHKELRTWLKRTGLSHIRILSINLLDKEMLDQYNSAASRPVAKFDKNRTEVVTESAQQPTEIVDSSAKGLKESEEFYSRIIANQELVTDKPELLEPFQKRLVELRARLQIEESKLLLDDLKKCTVDNFISKVDLADVVQKQSQLDSLLESALSHLPDHFAKEKELAQEYLHEAGGIRKKIVDVVLRQFNQAKQEHLKSFLDWVEHTITKYPNNSEFLEMKKEIMKGFIDYLNNYGASIDTLSVSQLREFEENLPHIESFLKEMQVNFLADLADERQLVDDYLKKTGAIWQKLNEAVLMDFNKIDKSYLLGLISEIPKYFTNHADLPEMKVEVAKNVIRHFKNYDQWIEKLSNEDISLMQSRMTHIINLLNQAIEYLPKESAEHQLAKDFLANDIEPIWEKIGAVILNRVNLAKEKDMGSFLIAASDYFKCCSTIPELKETENEITKAVIYYFKNNNNLASYEQFVDKLDDNELTKMGSKLKLLEFFFKKAASSLPPDSEDYHSAQVLLDRKSDYLKVIGEAGLKRCHLYQKTDLEKYLKFTDNFISSYSDPDLDGTKREMMKGLIDSLMVYSGQQKEQIKKKIEQLIEDDEDNDDLLMKEGLDEYYREVLSGKITAVSASKSVPSDDIEASKSHDLKQQLGFYPKAPTALENTASLSSQQIEMKEQLHPVEPLKEKEVQELKESTLLRQNN